MHRTAWGWTGLVLGLLGLTGCGGPDKLAAVNESCYRDLDCEPALVCRELRCIGDPWTPHEDASNGSGGAAAVEGGAGAGGSPGDEGGATGGGGGTGGDPGTGGAAGAGGATGDPDASAGSGGTAGSGGSVGTGGGTPEAGTGGAGAGGATPDAAPD